MTLPAGLRGRKIVEIETADFIRTVVQAKPGADAAVVDHDVEPVGIVHRGSDWAHHLARRILAMHTGYRLKQDLRIFWRAAPIAVDTYPMHRTAAHDLRAPDHGNIVLGLASGHASPAANAGIEADRHCPGVAVVMMPQVE
jgi:hypothetical protein